MKQYFEPCIFLLKSSIQLLDDTYTYTIPWWNTLSCEFWNKLWKQLSFFFALTVNRICLYRWNTNCNFTPCRWFNSNCIIQVSIDCFISILVSFQPCLLACTLLWVTRRLMQISVVKYIMTAYDPIVPLLQKWSVCWILCFFCIEQLTDWILSVLIVILGSIKVLRVFPPCLIWAISIYVNF